MSTLPNDFKHNPNVGGTSMGVNNKVGTSGKVPPEGAFREGEVGGVAAFPASKKVPVNKGVLSVDNAPIGGANKGK